MNKRNKKDLQTEQLFGERLLKAGRITLLIVPTIFLTTPIVVFVLDSMAMKYYLRRLRLRNHWFSVISVDVRSPTLLGTSATEQVRPIRTRRVPRRY